MMKYLPFSNELFAKAEEMLYKYYGLKALQSFIESEQPAALHVLNKLKNDYNDYISSCEKDELICCVLYLIWQFVKNNDLVTDEESFKKAMARYIRQDLLRLYIFGNDTVRNYNDILVKSKDGAIRLANCCNWIWNDVVKPYIDINFPDIKTVQQAKNELLTGRPRRGRRPNDARVPIIIWGTYQMLTDLHGFDTPMPNCLCNYLIRLLQHMSILPDDTEIDSLWIRAELRYIRSRPVKPRFDNILLER